MPRWRRCSGPAGRDSGWLRCWRTDPATDALLAASDEPSALARALAEAIRVQYGARLQAGDLDTITKQIQASLERAEQVRKVDLANGDEPDFVFSAAPVRPTT